MALATTSRSTRSIATARASTSRSRSSSSTCDCPAAKRGCITTRDIRAQIDIQASLYRLARGERARAAELNAVIQGMSDGVLVCDADGRVVLANQAASAILGDGIKLRVASPR